VGVPAAAAGSGRDGGVEETQEAARDAAANAASGARRERDMGPSGTWVRNLTA
jgi:hypothetical protein